MRQELDLSVDLIRHSITNRNVQSDIIGQDAEEPINEEGIKQAKLLAARFQKAGITHDYVYVSPYKRAQETCKIVCESYPKGTPIITVPEIREINQGDGRGKSRKELYTPERQAYFEAMGMSFHHLNGESLYDLQYRVWGWFKKEILDNPHTRVDKPLKLMIVTHGMCTKVMLQKILGFDHRMCWRVGVSNCSISNVQLRNGLWYVESINDTAHLL